MSDSVAFTHVDSDGRFTFGARDGSEQTVSADKPFVTDDAGDIAYLDASPYVKRSTGGAATGGPAKPKRTRTRKPKASV